LGVFWTPEPNPASVQEKPFSAIPSIV